MRACAFRKKVKILLMQSSFLMLSSWRESTIVLSRERGYAERWGTKMGVKNALERQPVVGEANEDTSVDVIHVVGKIKWFDVAKGFGFIVPDDSGSDVLLHVTCLRRDGYRTAYEGARIVCEALKGPKGLQALRILSMDESTAIHPSQLPPANTHVQVTPTSELEAAWVKWFNREKGFGFLTQGEGTPDIFIHMETLRLYGLTELRPHQEVMVRYGPGPKGRMATEIRPSTGGHIPASH